MVEQLRTRKYVSQIEDNMDHFEMHLRGDCVDAWDASGHLRFGRVVDVADDGLFIDFLCPDRRRELTPFDRVFKVLTPLHEWGSAERPTGTLEVLLRPNSRGPWTWMPAEFSLKQRLERGWPGEVGVVQLLNAEGVAEGPLHVVPPQRLRQSWSRLASASGPRSDADLRAYYGVEFAFHSIRPGTFFKGHVRLTAQLALLSEEMQWRLLEEWRDKVFLEEYVGYPLQFVQRMDDGCTWMYIERLDLGWCCKRKDGRKVRFHRFANRLMKALPGMIYKTLRLATESLPVNDEDRPRLTLPVDDEDRLRLPVELLLDVFSHMDTMQQTRLYRVCSSWSLVLQSPVLTSFLIIPRRSEKRADYPLTACLVHRLNSATQRLMILDSDKERVKETNHVMKFLASRCGALRLKAISFVRPECTLLLEPYRYVISWLDVGPNKRRHGWEMKMPTRLALAGADPGSDGEAPLDLWNLVEMHTACSERSGDRENGSASFARVQTEWQWLQNEIDQLCESVLVTDSDADCYDTLGDLLLDKYSYLVMCKLVEFVDILYENLSLWMDSR